MAATAQQDIGRGSVRRWMLQLALPAVVAQVINLLYNIVDRIYIGHLPEVGATALTGVGLCMPILMLLNAFAMLCGAGGAPRAAIATVASQGVSTVWVLRFLTGKRSILKLRLANLRVQPRVIVAFWALVMLLPEAFVRIFNNDPALVDYTVWAMRIYMLGIFSTGFQVSCQQSFVELGQAKISLLLACLRKLILLIPLIFLLPTCCPTRCSPFFWRNRSAIFWPLWSP